MPENVPKIFRPRDAAAVDIRNQLSALVAELRELDRRLEDLIEPLPAGDGSFKVLAEIRGTVETVRTDLLDDAIATLEALAVASDRELRRRFDERLSWLEAVAAS